MKRLLLACILAIALLPACERKKEEPPSDRPATATVETAPPAPTVPLLQEAVETTLVEYPGEALPVWRRFRTQHPALLLVANNPSLLPAPKELQAEIGTLLARGSDEEVLKRADYAAPDILIQPDMAVGVALENGFFSAVYWLFPSTVDAEALSLDKFREQMQETGLFSPEEADSLTLQDGIFSGRLRGVPFQAVHPESFKSISAPLVVHFDTGYLAPLYKGEIKTPLYSLINETLVRLRSASLQTLAVTISYSNLTGGVPLASRFVGPTLATLFGEPDLLDAEMPIQWRRRANALYLPNFFQNEEIRKVYLEMEKEDPTDPSVKYALYQISRELKAGDLALDYLAQAVALDKAYGLEYLELAKVAAEKNLADQSLRMLRLAAETFPENPFIALSLAEALMQKGHQEEAKPSVVRLQALPWSETYYPAIPEALKQLAATGE